jgi:hypothetical protein
MPSGGLVAIRNRNQRITSTLGWRKFTVNRFQPKSFNRRPNPEIEGSWSSTKMLNATIHDPHKKIRTQTPQNRRNNAHMKSNENSSKGHENHKSYKKEINTTMKASMHWEDRFSTNRCRKSTPMEQGNEKQSRRMVCPEKVELIYMSPTGPGKKTKLPLALKLWYKPLRSKWVM